MEIGQNAKVTRREFLPLAAGGFAVAMSHTAWAAAETIPTGIQLYTVKDDLEKDPTGTLQKIAQIGYREVEMAGLAKLTPEQFHDAVKDAGLRMPSAHLMFGMEDTGKLLDSAKALGVEYVVSSVLLPRPIDLGAGMKGFLDAINALTADDFKQIA